MRVDPSYMQNAVVDISRRDQRAIRHASRDYANRYLPAVWIVWLVSQVTSRQEIDSSAHLEKGNKQHDVCSN